MTDQVSVRVLQTRAEIEGVRHLWSSWQNHPNSDIDFYLMVHRVRPEIVRSHILVAYRNGIPDALLIGRVECSALSIQAGYARLFQVPTRRLIFIHGGFLGNMSAENSDALVRSIVSTLTSGNASLAVISHFNRGCPLLSAALRLPAMWSRDYAPQVHAHHSLRVPSSIELLYQRFSGKVRKNLRWQAKKLLTDFDGKVRIENFGDPAQLDRMFRDIEQVAAKTYQRGLSVGFEDSLEMRSRLRLAAERQWLHASILYIAERPCAFWVGTVYQGVFHSNFMGYDRKYGRYSPGIFLLLKVIEGFCDPRNGCTVREIDFGLGDAQYKQLLADREWQESSVSIFAPSLAGLGLNLLLTPSALVNRLISNALARVGLLQKFKTQWRLQRAKAVARTIHN